jgi:hypothetical protein
MAYGNTERRLAALLDTSPSLRRLAKAGYQRLNYLLNGWRVPALRLHSLAALARVPGGADGRECFHGYYDRQPWNRDGRGYLFHRWRRGSRNVEICVHDGAADRTTSVGVSRAWNFQQGSLAQWLAQDGREWIAYNDMAGRRLVCRLVGPGSEERIVEWPIQGIHPSGRQALSINYRRLARLRPEYGYDVEAENFSPDQPLDRDGIWRVDLREGGAQLIVSLERLAGVAARAEMTGAEHKVNHAVYSPLGGRFVFMHRWIGPKGKFSRLYVADADGTNLRLLLDHRIVSHYAWRDEDTLLVWARAADGRLGYLRLDVSSGAVGSFGNGMLDRLGDGHPSWSPDRRWIVTDSYPDRARARHLLLCRSDGSGTAVEVGAFHAPWRYEGPLRCDLHPRWSPDGRRISIDSAHEGIRATYVLDVGRLLA